MSGTTTQHFGFERSKALYQAAERHIPGGVTSTVRAGVLPHPIYFERGQGAYLFDIDGNRYIDYILAYGPPILGYAPDLLRGPLNEQIDHGLTFGAQHRGEIDLAELMCATVPNADQVVFSMSGSDAVTVALRIARTYTGRSKILKFEGHYHGWHDSVFASVGYSAETAGAATHPTTVPQTVGIPPGALDELIVAPWNDLEAVTEILAEHGRDVAAIILEPLNVNGGVIPPAPGFLPALRSLANDHGSLLVFDEIITGFRLALGGAQEFYGVDADLAIFAKAMAGGVAISAVTGRREFMDVIGSKRLVHNGTFNGNPLSCAAAVATLRYLTTDPGTTYGTLARLGERLAAGLREHEPLSVRAVGPIVSAWIGEPEEVNNIRDRVGTDYEALSKFAYQLLLRGVLARTVWYISTAHDADHVEAALAAVGDALST